MEKNKFELGHQGIQDIAWFSSGQAKIDCPQKVTVVIGFVVDMTDEIDYTLKRGHWTATDARNC